MNLPFNEAKQLLQNVKNFTVMWSGRWPYLDETPFLSEYYEKMWNEHLDMNRPLFVGEFKGNTCTIILDADEDEKVKEQFAYQIKHTPGRVMAVMQEYEAIMQQQFKKLEIIKKTNLSTLSDSDLMVMFTDMRTTYLHNAFIDYYDMYVEKMGSILIQNMFDSNTTDIGHVTNCLIAPHEKMPAYFERMSFFDVVDLVKDQKNAIDCNFTDLQNMYPNIYQAVTMYSQEHGYLRVVVDGPFITPEQAWINVQEFISTNAPRIINEVRLGDNYDEVRINEGKRIQETLTVDQQSIVTITRFGVALRVIDNAYIGRLTMANRPLYAEIYNRLGITEEEFKLLNDSEVLEAFVNKQKILNSIEARKNNLLVCVKVQGVFGYFDADEALQLHEMVANEKKENIKTVLKGKVASLSKTKQSVVTGNVKVLRTVDDAKQVVQGDIIAIATASAFFTDAISKAGAILTEFGGMTNHAVVVAREFNIPTIVGLNDLMNTINNNQLVMLNMETGEVELQ